jgi:hypothetical protein
VGIAACASHRGLLRYFCHLWSPKYPSTVSSFPSVSFDTMRFLGFLYPALLCASGAEALRSDKVKLSNIQSLTLRKGLDTSHRRVDAMPQVCSSCPASSAQADF